MRGGAQAHLIETDDGCFYVVKFQNNPQGGRRILINELIGSLLFDEFEIATPEPAFVTVDLDFLQRSPELGVSVGGERLPIPPGQQFGSRYPGTPGVQTIYDCFPDVLLPQLCNRDDFFAAMVMDKWLANADGRQAIFYRGRVPQSNAVAWTVSMIDHGGLFQGFEWIFRESPPQGVCCQRAVYGDDPSIRDFELWLDVIADMTPEDFEQIYSLIPAEWIGEDAGELRRVLARLNSRRGRLRALVDESVGYIRSRNREPWATDRQRGGKTAAQSTSSPVCATEVV